MKNMTFKRKLPVPKEIKVLYPVSAELSQLKADRDKMIADVFTGHNHRLILVIGLVLQTVRMRYWNTANVWQDCRR